MIIEIIIIDLKKEYPKLLGNVRWAIVTEMSYHELLSEFGEALLPYTPFITLTEEHKDEIIRFKRNDGKFRWRMRHKEVCIGYDDGKTESIFKTGINGNLLSLLEFQEKYAPLYSAMSDLTQVQKERIILNYIEGLPERKIAEMQGVCQKSVHESIASGIKKLGKSKKLKVFLKNTPSKAHRHS